MGGEIEHNMVGTDLQKLPLIGAKIKLPAVHVWDRLVHCRSLCGFDRSDNKLLVAGWLVTTGNS